MSTGLGLRICKRRKELGLSQEELAARMGLKSKSTICKIERGDDNLTTDTIRKYADALETTPSYLMGWEDFLDEVAAGQYEHEQIDQALEMLERYRKATPKVRSIVDLLLSSENSEALLENNQQCP